MFMVDAPTCYVYIGWPRPDMVIVDALTCYVYGGCLDPICLWWIPRPAMFIADDRDPMYL